MRCLQPALPLRSCLSALAGALLCCASLAAAAADAPTTREMNLISWQEFAEWVPGRIETVLVPVGTLEPHGVIPNGADNLAPEAMAKVLAPRLDALVAPTLNYGITGDLDAYPGTLSIDAAAYEAFVESLLSGLAGNGFRNIVILNGHGGPQTRVLEAVAERIGRTHRVRTLVTNWWAVASEDTFEVFGEDGGHAGNNETAYVQAIVPEHIHPERYSDDMAQAGSSPKGWSAYPFPSSIVLYQPGQGYPDFDPAKAERYFDAVNDRMAGLIADTIRRWDAAGIFRDTRSDR
ncbi:MAG TPA: creatininase family protein [Pseudomonadales bacterium]|nr:creatininase family protein [Pseudomonadales bacterium]